MRRIAGKYLAAAVSAALLALAPAALALSVHFGAVKGATYRGFVHGHAIALKVTKDGRSAQAILPRAVAFCQGGAGLQFAISNATRIGKKGAFSATITYTAIATQKVFATTLVKGRFVKIGTPAFEGRIISSFVLAHSCNGTASFRATKAKA